MKPELSKLKAEARGLYRDIRHQLDDVDCGLVFLSYVKPSFGRDVAKFRAVWARLQEIDPTCPKEDPL